MKRIVVLMLSGLMASAGALAQGTNTTAPAPATPAAAPATGTAPTGDQSAKKKHTTKKKTHKSTMAKADGDTKKSTEAKPASGAAAAPMAPAPDSKK